MVTFLVYVPTPHDVVDTMLELVEVTENDVLYDLGCGDGRILIMAAKKFGCRAKGCDLDPLRVKESRDNASRSGVAHLVSVEQRDIFKVDLNEATIVTLYLSPGMNARLLPQLRQLKPGARIVSHNFPLPGISSEQMIEMVSREDHDEHHVYLYRCPIDGVPQH